MPTITDAIALSAEGRNDEALAMIETLAAAGDPEGLFTLADAYWRGNLVTLDYVKARQLFAQASDAGHPIAIRAYTNLLASGAVGQRDWGQAMLRLRAEAKADTRREQMLDLIGAMNLTPTGHITAPPRGQQVSASPEIHYFRGLFSRAECDYLRLIAEPSYEVSMVVSASGEDIRDPMRSSEGAPMHWLVEDPVVHALNRRLAAASGTLYDQGEPLMILRYRPGQEYKKHFDALPGVDNQRIKTALVYLNEDYQGGETEFTQVGTRVKGKTGDVIVFVNVLANGRFDPASEHCGHPVTQGAKYLASRWIRARRHVPDARGR